LRSSQLGGGGTRQQVRSGTFDAKPKVMETRCRRRKKRGLSESSGADKESNGEKKGPDPAVKMNNHPGSQRGGVRRTLLFGTRGGSLAKGWKRGHRRWCAEAAGVAKPATAKPRVVGKQKERKKVEYFAKGKKIRKTRSKRTTRTGNEKTKSWCKSAVRRKG